MIARGSDCRRPTSSGCSRSCTQRLADRASRSTATRPPPPHTHAGFAASARRHADHSLSCGRGGHAPARGCASWRQRIDRRDRDRAAARVADDVAVGRGEGDLRDVLLRALLLERLQTERDERYDDAADGALDIRDSRLVPSWRRRCSHYQPGSRCLRASGRLSGTSGRCWRPPLAVAVPQLSVMLVAGARNRRYLQLWSGAA